MEFSGQIQGVRKDSVEISSTYQSLTSYKKNRKIAVLKVALPIIMGGVWVAAMVAINAAFPPSTALTVSMLSTTSYSTYLLGLGALGVVVAGGFAVRSFISSVKSKYFGLSVHKYTTAQSKLDQAWQSTVRGMKSYFKKVEDNYTFFASIRGREPLSKISREYFDVDLPQPLPRFLRIKNSRQFLENTYESFQDLLDGFIQELKSMRERGCDKTEISERQNEMVHEFIEVLAFIKFINKIGKDPELVKDYKIYCRMQPKIWNRNPEKKHLERLRLLTPFEPVLAQ